MTGSRTIRREDAASLVTIDSKQGNGPKNNANGEARDRFQLIVIDNGIGLENEYPERVLVFSNVYLGVLLVRGTTRQPISAPSYNYQARIIFHRI